MKALRIFFFILIIIGLGLLATQKLWVPKLVDEILLWEGAPVVLQTMPTTVLVTLSDKQAPNGIFCKETPNYFVISKSEGSSVGTNILLKYKTSEHEVIPCTYDVKTGDFEIKNGNAEYLFAITNHFLILDSGTAPYPRGLIVYDLNTRTQVFTDRYSAPIMIDGNTVSYWATTTVKPTTANCPQLTEWTSGGLGAGIESHVSLDLVTLTKKDLGDSRCSARQ